tara:strand:- start:8 stop:544 length:537 start_codon:yes stop_codon:yes gene_type:complete
MAALSVTNSFTAGTAIVAAQMNTNFSDIVSWSTGSPTLSTAGSTTTVNGKLAVTELATFSHQVYLNGATQQICYEGSSANDYETFLVATNATADRTITFPDATGTVALTTTVIPTSLIDAKGDLIAGTADDTAGRLAVGTNNYVLTADSGESTGLKWAAAADPTWENANNILTNSVFN